MYIILIYIEISINIKDDQYIYIYNILGGLESFVTLVGNLLISVNWLFFCFEFAPIICLGIITLLSSRLTKHG